MSSVMASLAPEINEAWRPALECVWL